MTRPAWLVILALFVGLGTPVAAQSFSAPAPVLIVPGQSIAALALGRSMSSTLVRLGAPAEVRTLREGALYTFPRYGLNVYAADGVVRAISTTNSLLRTAEGIALGATVADVRRVFGSQFSDAVIEGLMGIAYDQHGIAFGLDGVIVSVIMVYPPRVQAAAPGTPAVTIPGAAQPAAPTGTPPAAATPAVPAGQSPAPAASVPAAPSTGATSPPSVATGPTYLDIGLVALPRVDSLKPFSPETQYMSVIGFLRYVVYQQTGTWLTTAEATRMLQEQQRVRL
jgi:hypothetical protein